MSPEFMLNIILTTSGISIYYAMGKNFIELTDLCHELSGHERVKNKFLDFIILILWPLFLLRIGFEDR